MENNQLIVIKQLPEIEEHLKNVAVEIEKKVKAAKSLVCTEENKQEIKKIRTAMNEEFKNFEEQRKAVKEKVLAPYMQFEEVYKECISEKYKLVDNELKEKIGAIETEQKKILEDEARRYFKEYSQSKNIDFITFEKMGLKIGLSDNPTKLKKQITVYIDQKVDDLNLIETQEHEAEILVEYKETLNVSQAITTVTNRFKAIEEEKKKQEIAEKMQEKLVQMSNANIPKEQPSTAEQILQAPKEEKKEELFTMSFKVKNETKARLKLIKEFLENGGYDYE